jgi:hypothetical protein
MTFYDRFCTPYLSGRRVIESHPPRCGGLACVAPKGAEEKLAILLDIKIPILMYVFLPTVRKKHEIVTSKNLFF